MDSTQNHSSASNHPRASEASVIADERRLAAVERLPHRLRPAARAYLAGDPSVADTLAREANDADREAIDWEVAEDIAIREASTPTSGGEDWKVPGLSGWLSAQPIAPANLRTQLRPLVTAVAGLLSRWLATVEVCGDAGEDGMTDALMLAEAGLRRALASERLRVIEQNAATVGLAGEHPDLLATLRTLKSATTETAVLAAAYAMLVMDAPGSGAVDSPLCWFLRMGDIDAGGAS